MKHWSRQSLQKKIVAASRSPKPVISIHQLCARVHLTGSLKHQICEIYIGLRNHLFPTSEMHTLSIFLSSYSQNTVRVNKYVPSLLLTVGALDYTTVE